MKLPLAISVPEIARRLARHYGYRVTRSRGSHMTMTLTAGGDEHQVTVPRHRDVRIGTPDAILPIYQECTAFSLIVSLVRPIDRPLGER